MTICVVVFGAAVRPDGTASGSLRRRCERAAVLARGLEQPWLLATGGVGRYGPAEALVMREILLEAGVPESRILLEPHARDTLESVRLCTRMLRARPEVERLLVSLQRLSQPALRTAVQDCRVPLFVRAHAVRPTLPGHFEVGALRAQGVPRHAVGRASAAGP